MTHKCSQCGSHRVIPEVTIADQGQHSDGKLKAVVLGNPLALIFKDPVYAQLKARLCGACGHVELKAENAGELYEKYRETKG